MTATATDLATRHAHTEGRQNATPIGVRFAGLGALMIAVIIFYWAKWVTGPNFRAVSSGPSVPPTWMQVGLTVLQWGSVAAALATLYFIVFRPWRREGRPTADGLFVLATCTMWFQDPLGNYANTWYTYNSSLLNMGSWASALPGWLSPHHGSAANPEPLLVGCMYAWLWIRSARSGCQIMAWIKARFAISDFAAFVFILFPLGAMLELMVEPIVFGGFGAWVFPGGGGPQLFPNAYNKLPLFAMVLGGLLFASMTAFRYYRNGDGETIVERGISRLPIGSGVKLLLRWMALVAGLQLIMFFTWIFPAQTLLAIHPSAWPRAITSKSYFTDHLCGAETERICPQPGVPLITGDGSLTINPSGQVVIPPNSAAARLYGVHAKTAVVLGAGSPGPRPLPFDKKVRGPFTGTLLSWP